MELRNDISHLSVDICTRCQLKCPSCSTSKGVIRDGYIKEGFMSFDKFRYILDSNPQIKEVELSNWGEIFLNPEIGQMIKYAYEHDVSLLCNNGTNFNYVKEEVLEALVKYKVKCLNLSIDGACQETYVLYRRNGSFEKVMENIAKLDSYKHQYDSDYPKLSWQFIIFGHNEHEISVVKEMCVKMGMTFNPKMNHSSFSPIKDSDMVKRETGLDYASREEYRMKHKTEYKHPCYQCLFSPQINWNGDMLGCCVNKWRGFGNVFNQQLIDILQSDLYHYMIDVLFGEKEADSTIPCYYCPNLEKIKREPLTQNGFEKYSKYVPIALR